MSVGIKTLRLFFALWPDEAVRASLAQFVETLKQTTTARWVEPENFHITLAFLGAVNEDQLPLVCRIGDGIDGQSFELTLDRIDFWPKREIVWLSPSSTPAALANLASGLTAELKQAGFVVENRPYRAHLTLARRARPGRISSGVLDDPIRWSEGSFCLIESHLSRMGSQYRVRNNWNLSGFQAIPDDLSVR
ncbi:RNA 2',3'-cyclic phosphodiesterase [Methylocaldum szegediense]|uniref:RNA 2',3'-cyclic phosphodiesterase n=2 Tax=Methylocaldum szegediense TaxID=73780 RepID=A0ABM9I5S2_9GAMM|nr:RNA 2',3'-cyclic phosphodiesterase [Methylocaldum szegediense]